MTRDNLHLQHYGQAPDRWHESVKPRLGQTRAKANGKPGSKAEISRLSKEYLRIRNQELRAKTFMAETLAAKARGELVTKGLVAKQAEKRLFP